MHGEERGLELSHALLLANERHTYSHHTCTYIITHTRPLVSSDFFWNNCCCWVDGWMKSEEHHHVFGETHGDETTTTLIHVPRDQCLCV
mmetsp:Transcript_8162/g.11924  ORF Transcript_8162/g.11924 Transcript_8162/m.11924 type:complete len:89 (+) Transcript_8162:58-324(+)